MSKEKHHTHLKKVLENLVNSFGMPGLKDCIQHIEDPLDYEDPNERQSVISRNIAMLEQRMGILQRFSDVSGAQATQYVENPGNFSHDEWDKIERMKQDLNDYQDCVSSEIASVDAQIPSEAKVEITEKKKEKTKRKIGSYRGWIAS
jgi:hypothetical protein